MTTFILSGHVISDRSARNHVVGEAENNGIDPRDAAALFARAALATDEDGEDARDTLGEVYGDLEIIVR